MNPSNWSENLRFFIQITLSKPLLKDTPVMHKVKIFDDSGNLKKVISVETLKKRSDKLIESPSLYRKTHEGSKTSGIPAVIRGRRKK